ncbi:MAG: hypothetical protein ACRYFU_23895 [Janthinobacterium lividum]
MEVEKITGDKFISLEETSILVLDAGRQAFTSLVREFDGHSDALSALNEEWNAFEGHISALGISNLQLVEPLPSRRVLTEAQSEQLRQTLAARWGVNGYWYPLPPVDSRANVIAFHEELWEQRHGTAILLQALEERAISTCFALLEGSFDFELDLQLIDPTYCGDEVFITTDCDWLVYSSHESSIAVAGWLADVFRSHWPDWAEITYAGPLRTTDLRGTWRTA